MTSGFAGSILGMIDGPGLLEFAKPHPPAEGCGKCRRQRVRFAIVPLYSSFPWPRKATLPKIWNVQKSVLGRSQTSSAIRPGVGLSLPEIVGARRRR